MNVLILSASAKVLLVRSFREAAAERGGVVVACDCEPDSAALFEADHAALLPRTEDPRFADCLLTICERFSIRLVTPTRDGDLAPLSAMAPALRERGIQVLVPSAEALDLCRDKRRFAEFCQGAGFNVAPIIPPGAKPAAYPVFVRPRVGAGGLGARRIESAEAFAASPPDPERDIVQQLVTDPEYTVDVLMTLTGRPLQAVARSRLMIRNGESQKSRIEAIEALTDGALRLCSALKLVGHNVVQAFYSPAHGPTYIEINPRFGGASNLSIAGGLESPRRLLQMVAGEDEAAERPRPIREGLTMLRYSLDALVTPEEIAALGRMT